MLGSGDMPEPHAGAGQKPEAFSWPEAAGKGSLAELIEITGSADKVITIADISGPSLGVCISLIDDRPASVWVSAGSGIGQPRICGGGW